MREVLPTPAVASEELSDADLDAVCGGKEAWQVVGPIVKPILYPSRLRGASAAGGCPGGVCPTR
jgi:hypothetical protein